MEKWRHRVADLPHKHMRVKETFFLPKNKFPFTLASVLFELFGSVDVV